MTKNIEIKKIFLSTLFTIAFLAQFFIQFIHLFENHSHRVCISLDVKHIHKKEVDCKDLHLLIKNNYINFDNHEDDFIAIPKEKSTFFYVNSYQSTNLYHTNNKDPPIS